MVVHGKGFQSGILLAVFFALSGCLGSKPKPVDYQIYSEADSSLNRDASNRPLSVVLNVYQLTDRQAFVRLTFDDLVSGKHDSELFGDELLQKTELVVLPGDKSAVGMKLMPQAKYLGMVAVYRQPAEQQWRYLVPADEFRKTNLFGMKINATASIRLHDCHMTISGVAVDPIPGQKLEVTPACPVVEQNTEQKFPR
jgi:type VI secretion system protein VasD